MPIRSAQRSWDTDGVATDIPEHKRAEEALRQHTAQLEALRQVGLEITAQLDLDSLLHSIVSWATELLGGTSGGLYLYRPEQDVLEWAVAIGPNLAPTGTVLHRDEGLSGRVWETGEPLIVDDYQHWEGRAASYKGYPFKAVVGVPVRWGEEFLGVLDVLADSPRTFSLEDAELLSLFANQAAIAIRNARSYETERKQVAQLAVVNQVARRAASILDLDRLLQEVVTAIQKGFNYHSVSLFLLDEIASELEILAIAGGFEDNVVAPGYRQAVGVGMVGWAAETGQSLLANDVSQEPRYTSGCLKEEVTRSELCVPLKLVGQVIGVLDVQDAQLNAFDETDLIAMETLADQIAVAIQNAQLYGEAQQELAERKRTEEALRESEEKFRKLARAVEQSPSTVVITDTQGNIEYVNPRFTQLTGYKANEVLGQNPRLLKSGKQPSEFYKELWDTILAGEEWQGEFCNREKSGELYWELASISPIRNAEGVITHFVKVAEDITGRKQAEEALRESEEKFRQFFENDPEYCYMVSPEGVILDVNSAVLKALGYGREGMIGKPLKMIYAPESLPKMKRLFAKWEKTGYLRDEEMVILTKKGDKHTVLLSAGVVKDRDGKTLYSVSVQRDITKRKQAEEERERLILELQDALAKVKTLSGLLPICASCKKIRDDAGYWSQLETYIQEHSEAEFSHGICPECAKKLYPEFFGDDE